MGKFARNAGHCFAFDRGIGGRGKGHGSDAHEDTSLIEMI
jgi:hypothetical protein